MEVLEILKRANAYASEQAETSPSRVSISLVTNFTDQVLQKLITGLCVSQGIAPDIYAAPYGQYAIELKNPASGLSRHKADITFVCFDVNPYIASPFRLSSDHAEEALDDLVRWSEGQNGPVIVTTFPLPYDNAYGNLFQQDPLFAQIQTLNASLIRCAAASSRIHVCDINRLLHVFGERRARDFRHLYASDIPFTSDFSLFLCQEWFAYIQLLKGNVRKCIVVDLDHTLWGGVVGEEGPLGVAVGPGYPGRAFQEFQRALLSYYDRGILLAINSRNNLADVMEVFEKNPHMVLQPKHFAAMAVNWNDKAQNLAALAEELNIGLGSFVFFDDDAMNRALVRKVLPEVLVPDFNVPPEDYVSVLYGLRELNQLRLTDEDRSRARMTSEENERKKVQSVSQSVEEYIAALGLSISVKRNAKDQVPRLAQLTQKTNQFNLTTRRLTDSEVESFMDGHGMVFAADVVDKYGAYGTTILAMLEKTSDAQARLNIMLMSCRVMGRGVEYVFLDSIVQVLKAEGITDIVAEFLPTAKNDPSKDFLPVMGFQLVYEDENGKKDYHFSIANYQTDPKIIRSTITLRYE